MTATYDDNTTGGADHRVMEGDRSDTTAGWGNHKFISNEDLNKATPTCQYLKDNCLLLQVTKLKSITYYNVF